MTVEQTYFLERKRQELNASIGAACAEARMIHFDLAQRYGVRAAEAAEMAWPGAAYGANDPRLRLVA